MQHHVFLSYSRKDSDIMQQISADLRAADLLVWTDEKLVPGTDSWKNAIENAIQNTGTFVVILTPDSKQSIWVEREMDYARACGIPIIPLLARGENEVSAVPFELINAQRVDIRLDYDDNFPLLIGAIQQRLNLPHTPAPLPTVSAHQLHSGYTLSATETLDPWNFLDQTRVLGWLFFDPNQFINYRAAHGSKTLKQTGAWLVSNIAWIPMFFPVLGFVFGTVHIPGVENDFNANALFILTSLLMLGDWLIGGILGWRESHAVGLILLIIVGITATAAFWLIADEAGVLFVAGGGQTGLVTMLTIGISIGAAAGIAFHLANPGTGPLAGLVLAGLIVAALFSVPLGIETGVSGLAMAMMAFGVAGAIDINLRTGQRSLLGMVILGILTINVAVMIWTYFLGGWQVLSTLQ